MRTRSWQASRTVLASLFLAVWSLAESLVAPVLGLAAFGRRALAPCADSEAFEAALSESTISTTLSYCSDDCRGLTASPRDSFSRTLNIYLSLDESPESYAASADYSCACLLKSARPLMLYYPGAPFDASPRPLLDSLPD